MTTTKPLVTIKGTKDGLVFHMDDACSYQELLAELNDKLDTSRHHFEKGPLIEVTVHLGYRYLRHEQEQELKDMIRSKGNLVVNKIESELVTKDQIQHAKEYADVKVIPKTIRSGQVYEIEGNTLILGDVNPGGCIQASGNIYVLGALRGMAHAGYLGDEGAIISASVLQPTQLRIATIVSRPPDQWEEDEYEMEFAYIEGQQILVDKLHKLTEKRPNIIPIM
ncbi:septum site-determining protein MinC [Caldalkalibacillus salinus]|uniref:septum site-determining protein MinC n=1 Tax=Caldalkalibacillus salinus TaxID=2803787 RepID=UPI001923486A|nr:septum site-determining protein MinC [Caldalkalibacillus salinus]